MKAGMTAMSPVNEHVRLRPIIDTDLPIFYAHQRDPAAWKMAAFRSRPRQAFMAHWKTIRSDPTVILRTILWEDRVAGTVMSFLLKTKRQVGYWIGREYWGKGIATAALEQFLLQVKARPLYAHVAQHNTASLRVLEKCGFTVVGEEPNPPLDGEDVIMDYVLKLGRKPFRPG